jgi:hypothetical protein
MDRLDELLLLLQCISCKIYPRAFSRLSVCFPQRQATLKYQIPHRRQLTLVSDLNVRSSMETLSQA